MSRADQEVLRKTQAGAKGDALTVYGMGGCYALGTFTDNFYKQCAVLLAASLHLTSMQSYATVLFSLPFILFSAWAGWLADLLPKKQIVVAAKIVEMGAIAVGGFMLVQGNWTGILLVLFFLGLQAAFFSPALNGSIPEVFAPSTVPRVNSLIKLASTAAVLGGMAAAGFFLDFRYGMPGPEVPDGSVFLPVQEETVLSYGIIGQEAFGRTIASVVIFLITIPGVLIAFALKRLPSVRERGLCLNPFPLAGPWDSCVHFLSCRNDPLLFTVLLAESYFYGIAALTVISISNLAISLGYSDTVTSLLSAVMMVGIAVGALIAGKGTAESWKTHLFPSACGMAVFMLLTGFSPLISQELSGFLAMSYQMGWLLACLFCCGICGGLYLIPLASFIQVRPSPSDKGKVIGVSNFLSFISIAAFGVLFFFLTLVLKAGASSLIGGDEPALHVFVSAVIFGVYSFSTFAFAAGIRVRNKRYREIR